VILDSVAYSNNPKGPWVPMNSSTAIFKEPKKHPKPHIHHSNPPHDPANKVFDDIDFIVPEH